jgi:hypothetical protein
MTNEELVKYIDNTDEAINVRIENETIWLNAYQMATLFNVDRTGIVRHVQNVYKTNELNKKSTCAKIAQVAKDGKTRDIDFYNLDMIISVGYRVNSKRGTQFRIWATKVLKKRLLEKHQINNNKIDLKNTISLIENIVKGKDKVNITIGTNATFNISNNTIGNIDNSFNNLVKTIEEIDDKDLKNNTDELKTLVKEKKKNKAIKLLKDMTNKLAEVGGAKLAESAIEQAIKALN